MVWGRGIALLIKGSLYGTLGWAGGMLSGLTLRGYWPGEHDAPHAGLSSTGRLVRVRPARRHLADILHAPRGEHGLSDDDEALTLRCRNSPRK
jgi:hypothetical protein